MRKCIASIALTLIGVGLLCGCGGQRNVKAVGANAQDKEAITVLVQGFLKTYMAEGISGIEEFMATDQRSGLAMDTIEKRLAAVPEGGDLGVSVSEVGGLPDGSVTVTALINADNGPVKVNLNCVKVAGAWKVQFVVM